jgi:type I restriction enzyme, R subunit
MARSYCPSRCFGAWIALLNSPTLSKEIMNAVMDALAAHTTMSKQAIDSERVRDGLKDILLGPAQLYEALRDKAGEKGLEAG